MREYPWRSVPGTTPTPDAIDGFGLVTVAFVGLAVGARAVIPEWSLSTICRETSITLPVDAFASAAVSPGRAAKGMVILVPSDVYPVKISAGETCIFLLDRGDC